MKYRSVAAFAMLVALIAAGASARASDGDIDSEAYAKRLFANDFAKQDKSYACFVPITTPRIWQNTPCKK
jgi:hypothetical protein